VSRGGKIAFALIVLVASIVGIAWNVNHVLKAQHELNDAKLQASKALTEYNDAVREYNDAVISSNH
jgi:hypothetical protein